MFPRIVWIFFNYRSQWTDRKVYKIKNWENTYKKTSQFTHTGLGKAKTEGDPGKTEGSKYLLSLDCSSPVNNMQIIAQFPLFKDTHVGCRH